MKKLALLIFLSLKNVACTNQKVELIKPGEFEKYFNEISSISGNQSTSTKEAAFTETADIELIRYWLFSKGKSLFRDVANWVKTQETARKMAYTEIFYKKFGVTEVQITEKDIRDFYPSYVTYINPDAANIPYQQIKNYEKYKDELVAATKKSLMATKEQESIGILKKQYNAVEDFNTLSVKINSQTVLNEDILKKNSSFKRLLESRSQEGAEEELKEQFSLQAGMAVMNYWAQQEKIDESKEYQILFKQIMKEAEGKLIHELFNLMSPNDPDLQSSTSPLNALKEKFKFQIDLKTFTATIEVAQQQLPSENKETASVNSGMNGMFKALTKFAEKAESAAKLTTKGESGNRKIKKIPYKVKSYKQKLG